MHTAAGKPYFIVGFKPDEQTDYQKYIIGKKGRFLASKPKKGEYIKGYSPATIEESTRLIAALNTLEERHIVKK